MSTRQAPHSTAARTLCVLLCVSQAYGHGHVTEPPSRAELCSNIHTPASEKNTNCGKIKWQPFSIEGPDGWPADGTIPAGGAQSRFPELNEQTATRWGKVPMSGGATKFTWTFNKQANHVTKGYTYYMTRAGWNPNAPLTRATFEDAPFCVVDGGMKKPPMTTDHTCNVPTLEGYHIILSVWDVGDTSNSFFNVIDVMFSGGVSPPVPVPTVPAPVPTTPCASSAFCVYAACKRDASCCAAAGTPCAQFDGWYAECMQSSSPPPATSPPTPPAPVPVPSSACSGSTLSVYSNCLGATACCESGTQCYEQSQWYAQCLRTCTPGGGWSCKVLG